MKWQRIRVGDKMAFFEDMQGDATLTDLQKRMIAVIARNWSNPNMHSECSNSFIAVGAGTTVKMVKKYKPDLISSGRVSVKKDHTFTESTLWDVNWFFRGSAYTRYLNGGNPLSDGRKEVPNSAHGWSPELHEGGHQGCIGGGPQVGAQFHPLKGCIGAPLGASPVRGSQGVAPLKTKKENTRKQPGFARWKIVHAEYEGEDEDVLVAHLRSGANRKFVLRCRVESEEYYALDEALSFDGDAESIIGDMISMSVNRTGTKEIRRADPLPWQIVTILSGETSADGAASMKVRFDDDVETTMRLTADQTASLLEACGGETEIIGARLRYRLMPDDSLEFCKL
ncbi:hypothetical protein [Pseudochrobactrum sp. MP213Fo]|uniref:hypothetical protein n=1 Tax=Pseudochrobactrum sp. MP213Fo TaxID=3022250 RepID=UPI003BA31A73